MPNTNGLGVFEPAKTVSIVQSVECSNASPMEIVSISMSKDARSMIVLLRHAGNLTVGRYSCALTVRVDDWL